MRLKTALLFSAALLAVPALTVSAAAAGDPAPVEFGTDPSAAHPKYVYENNETAGTAAASDETPASSEASAEITRQDILAEMSEQAPSANDGQFDYGYASNEIELRKSSPAATGAPSVLIAKDEVAAPGADATPKVIKASVQGEDQASPYRQDPLYTITGSSVEAKAVSYSPSAGGQIITVEMGETVYAIGRKYDVKPAEIIALNGLRAPYHLEIGQQLRLPILENAQATKATIITPAKAEIAPELQQVEYKEPNKVAAPIAKTPVKSPTIMYTVQQGDTLYSLSRKAGITVDTLAAANRIAQPYTLSIGQQLIIPGTTTGIAAPASPSIAKATPAIETGNRNTYIDPEGAKGTWTKPGSKTKQIEASIEAETKTEAVSYPTTDLDTSKSRFSWPVQGQIVMNFGLDTEGRRNDGINIAAPTGTPIRSVADGEIVYRGSDLDGYGNLLLIKHTDGWVSAYAHTDAMLVRKGETVKKGQIVAKVGSTGAVSQPQLHFELRHNLKPTDPLAALEGRNKAALQNVSLN